MVLNDAKSIQKKQLTKKEYLALQDIKAGYSPQRMLEILGDELGGLLNTIPKKDCYSLEDAQALLKRRYKKSQYSELQDIEAGYSPQRMLEILQQRLKYLIERGSTLNNPHISGSYFESWDKITDNHASTLKIAVKKYLSNP